MLCSVRARNGHPSPRVYLSGLVESPKLCGFHGLVVCVPWPVRDRVHNSMLIYESCDVRDVDFCGLVPQRPHAPTSQVGIPGKLGSI